MNARTRAAYLGCCVIWGSTWSVIKLGLRDLPPLFFAGSRMLLAALVLLPFALRAGLRRQGRSAIRSMAFVGLLQIGIPYALLFAAQQWVPSGLAAVLFATFPVWLVLVASVLLHDEPLTPRKILAALLGIAGVGLLELPALRGQAMSPLAALGGGLVLAASVTIAFVQVFAGALFLSALSSALEHGRPFTFTPLSAFALVYLALLGTAVTYLFLFWLIPRVPISAIGAIPLLDTTVAVILGAALLGEHLGWPLLAGGALVLCGAALANQPPTEPAPQSA